MWTVPFRPALPASTHADALLHQARRAFQDGTRSAEELLPPALAYVSRSWQRSVEAGLDIFATRLPPPHLSHAELEQATERHREWLTLARPVMEYLLEQTSPYTGMVALAGADGLLLQTLGDPHCLRRAERAAVSPGAFWLEQHRGTNAIGTALAEAAPVMVHGLEHYLECNGLFSCAAAPVRGPDGQLLGALDFTSEHRRAPAQAFGAVCAAAHMIETRLFMARHAHDVRLHFHPLPEGLGTMAEGVLAISEDGVLAGMNEAARAMLGLSFQQLGQIKLTQIMQTDLAHLLRQIRAAQPLQLIAAMPGHTRFHARVMHAPAKGTRPAPAQAPAPAQPETLPPPLRALDTGDGTWHAVLSKAGKVINKPIALLLHGESGSGKEVLAHAIHQASDRATRAFVPVNCAALPEPLIEAELFGYAPGAFTGARREGAPGLIRQAHGGTLFLDEIGDMPLPLQTRLLRVLQERRVTPLGGGPSVAVDFALICATHRDLRAEVNAGRFRDDLYWRLNGLTLRLPPLRQRHDFDTLVARMLASHASGRPLALAPNVAAALCAYPWPGNLRQLDSVLCTAAALAGDSPHIGWEHLPDDLVQELCAAPPPAPVLQEKPCPPASAITMPLAQHTQLALRQAVERAGGNISQAAQSLGISRSTLYRRLRQAG